MKQKTDVELLSEAIYEDQLIPTLNMDEIREFIQLDAKGMLPSMALAAMSNLRHQLQAIVDELKQRCEELEKYAYHKNGCDLNTFFGTEKVCTCGLDQLLTPNERK